MVDKLIKEIEELLNSEISSYKIAKDSGVSYSLISDYRNNKRKIENMTLQVANKLIKYTEKLKMRNYDKMMIVVNELVLEDGATVTYWTEENPNDCTCCYSVEELKAHLGNMNEDEYEKLVFQVDFEEDEERSYQFYMSEYKDVLNGNKFTLDCLRNTR